MFFGLIKDKAPPVRFLQCPFCLENIGLMPTTKHCQVPTCGQELPTLYYERGEEMPVLFVPLIGFPSCGKTVGLNTMVWNLERISAVWPRFYIKPLTSETDVWLRSVRIDLMNERLPDGTQVVQPNAYVFALANLPRWRNRRFTGRTLVVRDLPGEEFMRGLHISDEIANLLVRSRVAMMMFALSDLENSTRNSSQSVMSDLMNRYITTLERAGVNLKERRPTVVIVLSQADQFVAERFGWPPHLVDYVRNDPIYGDIARGTSVPMTEDALDRYLTAMDRASDDIRDHLLTRPTQSASMRRLLSMADDSGLRLRFTIMSALGHEPDRANRKLLKPATPLRVLDPLFTALELGRAG